MKEFEKNGKFNVDAIVGDDEMWKDRLFSVINTFDPEKESFVSFRITKRGEDENDKIETIMNVSPRELPTLLRAFKMATSSYIEKLAEHNPMMAAKVMANIMINERNEEEEDKCTCGHCDA